MVVLNKPVQMPQPLWDSLVHYLITQKDRGFSAEIMGLQLPLPATPHTGYWRAQLLLNGVRIKVYYSPKKGRWIRS